MNVGSHSLWHGLLSVRNEQTLLEDAETSVWVREDKQMSPQWRRDETAFVTQLMRGTGGKVADDDGTVTTTESMSID